MHIASDGCMEPAPAVARVLTDVPALDREFDYLVPQHLVSEVRIGTIVRVQLQGRRVRGWVTSLGAANPDLGVSLKPIAKVTGWGPPAEILELAAWAAWRWAGRRVHLLRTASPDRAVRHLGTKPSYHLRSLKATEGSPTTETPGERLVAEAFQAGPGLSVLRLPPAYDSLDVVLAAGRAGSVLVVMPSRSRAESGARRLRERGLDVALMPEDWAHARSGAQVVIGARSAVWAPCPDMQAVVVIDGHDQGHIQEQAPTWNAMAVAVERARRVGVPVLVTSACPTLEMLASARLLIPERSAERSGWAKLHVVDQRKTDPREGLFSETVVEAMRRSKKVVCVLNRIGRARLLACRACGDLARCEKCGSAVSTVLSADSGGEQLQCSQCSTVRPKICASCGSLVLRTLRIGVNRAVEEASALVPGRIVTEVTGATASVPSTSPPEGDVLLGTEAVLHRVRRADAVIFLDFDQELLASRYTASEDALTMLARASRLVGGREGGVVLVQTRIPDHPVLDAALHGDPDRLVADEESTRKALDLPPFSAMAAMSGESAPEFAGRLMGEASLEVLGPHHGRWTVRASTHDVLCDVLASVPRPQTGRVRIEMDPRGI